MITLPATRRETRNYLDFSSAMKVAMRKARLAQKLKTGEALSKSERDLMIQETAGVDVADRPVNFLSNTKFKFGPIALTTTLTTNIFNPGTTTGGVNCTSAPFDKLYVIMTYICVVNKTGSAATVSLWVGATGANAAGTEFLFQAYSVAANSYVDRYPQYRFGQADFLVGGAGTTTALSIQGSGEIGIGA